jgi:hypothetical protein
MLLKKSKSYYMTLAEILKGALIGKKLRHKNRYGRTVILEIEDIKTTNHSEPLEPATPENDWWPASNDWTETRIYFVDGSNILTNQGDKLDIFD